MSQFRAYVASGILLALPLAAQPVISAIENNYSYIPAGLPNYGIAQGSIFVIFGQNLAPATSGLQSVPLKATLSGVSVQFSVQGVMTQALLYYVTPTQIAGILPSATPAKGREQLRSLPEARTASSPVTVVQSAVGILTLSGGFGPAWAMDGSNQLFPGVYAANPGDTLTFYGTGAGPVTGDESVQQIPRNLSNIPLDIEIGGVSATVTYHGRSLYPGLDQFNVVVPQGPAGCNVSVTAQAGNYLSNSVFVPVAASGRMCSDAAAGNSTVSISVTSTGNNTAFGTLFLGADETIETLSTGLLETTVDVGSAGFQSLAVPGNVTVTSSNGSPLPSIGGCLVNSFAAPATPPPTGTPGPQPPLLNAGPAINFMGPNGFASLPAPSGNYDGPLSLNTGQMFLPPGGGSFTIDNGSGGPDIGAFSEKVSFPPLLVFSNVGGIGAAIDRSRPLTVQWSGGNANGYLRIVGHSSLPPANGEIVSANLPVAPYWIPRASSSYPPRF